MNDGPKYQGHDITVIAATQRPSAGNLGRPGWRSRFTRQVVPPDVVAQADADWLSTANIDLEPSAPAPEPEEDVRRRHTLAVTITELDPFDDRLMDLIAPFESGRGCDVEGCEATIAGGLGEDDPEGRGPTAIRPNVWRVATEFAIAHVCEDCACDDLVLDLDDGKPTFRSAQIPKTRLGIDRLILVEVRLQVKG